MFKKKQQAQPKEAYEQPEVVEEVSEKQLPISPFTGEPYDPEWGTQVKRPKADKSIIGKYYH